MARRKTADTDVKKKRRLGARPLVVDASEESLRLLQALVEMERDFQGWSYNELAERSGCCHATAVRFCLQDTRWPRYATVLAMCGAVGWAVKVTGK